MKALILAGDGINCEVETAQAFALAGFEPEIFHLNDLISSAMPQDKLARDYAALALPGGFSFGDDLSSGKVLALKILHGLKWNLKAYAEKGGLVIGICNGFQALIRLGIFGKNVSITHNIDGKFINRWVRLEPVGKKCVWLSGLGVFELPIRHGEGRICFPVNQREEVVGKMRMQERLCLRYTDNPNGSEENLAGLCDATGRILGLMPHPEAFVRWTAHPEWTFQAARAGSPGQGLALFENAFHAAKGAK